MSEYKFPSHKLLKPSAEGSNVVLISCGSFNPITFAHLRLFETARDILKEKYGANVIGGFLSTVNDGYKKKGLMPAKHRAKMIELSLTTNDWICHDPWESLQPEYCRTRKVLNHFSEVLKAHFKNVEISIPLLCGADLLQSFTRKGVWKQEDMEFILGNHGVVCMEREGVNLQEMIDNDDLLKRFKEEIMLVPSLIVNDVSATKIRDFLKRGFSTKYLIGDEVGKYIEENKLYKEE